MSDLDIRVLNRQKAEGSGHCARETLYQFSLNSGGKEGVSLTGLTANRDFQILDKIDNVVYIERRLGI